MLFCSLFGFVGCEQEEPTPAASLVLSVDCNEIANDGLALASFMVKKDGVNVTSECRFYNVESGEPLSGAYFTSTVAGTYTFYAVMGMEKSNTVEVKVVDAGNDTPNDDPNDNPNDNPNDDPNDNPNDNPNDDPNDDPNDEPIVEEKPITLEASADTIKANGQDFVAFTVKQEGVIVTDACSIYVNGAILNGNRFSTFQAGVYTIYATKGTVTSNEVVVTVEAIEDMGTTVVFAEGVSLTSGWYDVNKKSTPSSAGADAMMCWAAASSNIAQWFQNRYVAAGNTLPDGCPNGTSSSYGYELQIMDVFRDNWDNLAKGGWPDSGLIWYFEGRDLYSTMNDSNRAHPRSGTGGYFATEWSTIFDGMYHNEAGSYVAEINNYSWRGGVADPLKRFSEYVIDAFEHGMSGMAVAISSNFSGGHAVTIWGYEVDNATGYITKLYIADSDDGAMPTLAPYTVRSDSGNAKIALVGHTTYYPMALYPVSGYDSATK